MDADATLRLRAEGVPWIDIDGEIVALDTAASEYLGANASASLLWHALVEGATRDELVGRLIERYGIGRDLAGADVDRFLQALEGRGLIAR